MMTATWADMAWKPRSVRPQPRQRATKDTGDTMLDQILTLQTLAGTVSGAAITLVLTACTQRLRFSDVVASQRPPSVSADVAPPVSSVEVSHTPASPAPAVIIPPTAPPIVRAHYVEGLNRKTRVAPVKAARVLIDFMQAHDAGGYFTPGEINEWWRWACAELNLDPLHPDVVRAELAALPNVWKPNTRLNAPEYRAVKARTGKERSILYRIPAARSEAGSETVARRDNWTAPGTGTGQRPASAKKPEKPKASGMVSGSALYREAA